MTPVVVAPPSGSGDWGVIFAQYLLLSLLSIGGAIGTAPDMHRFLVEQHHWMTNERFSACVAIAQAAPGPNLLFVAVLGWSLGGFLGMGVTMAGILLPSTALTLFAARWGEERRTTRGVRAFVAGMAPLTVGLVLSTGFILGKPAYGSPWLLATMVATVLVCVRTKVSPLWLIAAGGLAGAFLG